jgi:hypothetical protein
MRGALTSIEEHTMSEKFDPAPLDKHAEKPGKKDPLSDKAHGELEKGLEDSFPASDPPRRQRAITTECRNIISI